MMHSRRSFLSYLAQHTAGLATLSFFNPFGSSISVAAESEIFWGMGFSPTARKGDGPDSLYPSYPSEFRMFDSKFKLVQATPLSFYPHSIVQNPGQRKQVVAIVKWGRDAAVINTESKVVERILAPPTNHRFFGHGTFISPGRILISAMNDADHTGQILEYDTASGKHISAFSSFGANPHELKMAPNDPQTLVVMCMGRLPRKKGTADEARIVWIDLKTRISKKIIQSEFEIGPTHFEFMDSKSDSLLIGGVSHSPAVELIQASEHHFIRSPNPSTDLNIETLNFQVSDEGTKKWYVASPDASEIFTLNLKDKTLKSLLKRNHARHIFKNKGQFFYSYEVKNSSISRLSEKNLSGKWSDLEVETFGNSPHLTRLTFT